MHPPSKLPLWELALVDQQYQPYQRSSLPQRCSQSLTTKGHLSISPSVALAHPGSMDFYGNLTCASLKFLAADVDPGQRDHSVENAATRHDAHVLVQRHFFSTPDSDNGLAFRQRLMVLSRKTCQAHTFFIQKVFFHRILQHPFLVFVSSPLVSNVSILREFCDGTCLRLCSLSFSSVNLKTYVVHQIRKLWYQIEAGNSNYSSMETTIVLSPTRKRSDTKTPSHDQ